MRVISLDIPMTSRTEAGDLSMRLVEISNVAVAQQKRSSKIWAPINIRLIELFVA